MQALQLLVWVHDDSMWHCFFPLNVAHLFSGMSWSQHCSLVQLMTFNNGGVNWLNFCHIRLLRSWYSDEHASIHSSVFSTCNPSVVQVAKFLHNLSVHDILSPLPSLFLYAIGRFLLRRPGNGYGRRHYKATILSSSHAVDKSSPACQTLCLPGLQCNENTSSASSICYYIFSTIAQGNPAFLLWFLNWNSSGYGDQKSGFYLTHYATF